MHAKAGAMFKREAETIAQNITMPAGRSQQAITESRKHQKALPLTDAQQGTDGREQCSCSSSLPIGLKQRPVPLACSAPKWVKRE